MSDQLPNVSKIFHFTNLYLVLCYLRCYGILRCDFVLLLVYVISFVECIFVFAFCTCAVSITGLVAIVSAHKQHSIEL